jgi:hypothetical protein
MVNATRTGAIVAARTHRGEAIEDVVSLVPLGQLLRPGGTAGWMWWVPHLHGVAMIRLLGVGKCRIGRSG